MQKPATPLSAQRSSPDGKAYEWPLYDLENRQVMIFDEFSIHPEKEADRKFIDGERTCFATKYFCMSFILKERTTNK